MATKKVPNEERVVDLLERLGAIFLYTSTDMDKHAVAKAIGVGNDRVSEILKGIAKKK